MLEALRFDTGDVPTTCIFLLHGLGADPDDLVPVARYLRFPFAVRYVLPAAPMRPVTLNRGMRMPAWYDLSATEVRRGEDADGIARSVAALEALVAVEVDAGIAPERIVLAGFSQGCAMALATGLHTSQRLAAIAGMSGYLPACVPVTGEGANRGTPIFLAHGTDDPVVSIDLGRASRDALVLAGHRVEWHEYPIDHTLSEAEIAALQAFLAKALAAAG